MRSAFILFFTILVYQFSNAQIAPNYRYGLDFKSHQSNLDERTQLSLNVLQPTVHLKSGFSISFDLKLRKETQTFGYVFRMVVDQQSSLDFLVNLSDNEFNFVINDNLGQLVASKKYTNQQQVVPNKWMNIQIHYFTDRTEIFINKQKLVLQKGFDHFKDAQFYFGANKTKYFFTTEVPPMTIKNIKLFQDGEMLRHWMMAKHSSDMVYDELENAPAEVKQGNWEIDNHAKWVKTFSLTVKGSPQIASDAKNGRIFMATDQKVYTYNLAKGKMDTITVKSGHPYLGISRQIIYDSKKNQLISYTTQNPSTYTFSFQTQSWSGAPSLYVDSRQHHNHILDSVTNSLYLLNGYGYHRYNGELMKLDLSKQNANWSNSSLNPSIQPRYLSALGVLNNNEALVLGGYGSKSGRQEEFPHHFYDLHKINYKNGKSQKLWDLNLDTTIVFSNAMHVDAKENKLYVLGYNNFSYKSKAYLYSADINTKNPVLQSFANAIPFNFLDIESYCDLFYDQSTQKLYAILSQKLNDGEQEINVYQIAYPIFSINDIQQQHETPLPTIYIFIIIGAAIVLAFVYYAWMNARLKRISKVAKLKIEAEHLENTLVEEKIIESKEDQQCLKINVFNGFQIIDKNNKDHSSEFTPVLKQIFLFLLFHSIKNQQRGVSSHELDQTFWQGMTPEKATNNRSVNMRKLRILIQAIGAIEVEHKNSYWILNINEKFICDYQLVLDLLISLDKANEYTKTSISQIILHTHAKLLPGIENEWLDSFKSDFTSLLIKVLKNALQAADIIGDNNLRLKMLEVILIHDSLEENAIILKCNLLYKMGQKGQSKHTFDKYISDYKLILNAVPNLSYNDIIAQDL